MRMKVRKSCRYGGLALTVLLLLITAACAPHGKSVPAGERVSTDQEQAVRVIPVRDFFRKPESAGYSLSPDGKLLGYMRPWNRRLNVFVRPVTGGEEVQLTYSRDRDIAGFGWANNERVVYVRDKGGDENYHLFAIDADGTDQRDLTPFDGVRVSVIDDLEHTDDMMLIGMNRRDPRVFDAYRINIRSGELTLAAENPGNIEGWVTDHEGKLRAAVATDGVKTSILFRKTESDPFETLVTTDFTDSLSPLAFTFDNEALYVASNLGRDRTAIYVFDPETRELGDIVFERDDADVYRLLMSEKRKVLTGVAYTTDRTRYHFFDPDREKLQHWLEKNIEPTGRSEGHVAVVGMSRDERRVLAVRYSDRTLGSYWFHDRDSGELVKLAELSPWLDPAEMAPMQPISYEARDGLKIHGYLTLPPGRDARNIPAVMLVHGGPWARDVWGFDPEAQFLANRGFAVLQVNFRGSTGYGKSFWKAGFKEWGRAMQDDVTDGVRWLIDRGIADPDRVAIYGASYGGYATLAGLAFTPDLYAAGVDYVGVSNIFTLLETLPPYWENGRKMMYAMIGDPEKDAELLRAVSPVFHADRIKAPLLVAQGANDPRVKKAESDQIVNAMRERGVDVEYIVKDNEGHGFSNEENRFEFYEAMERFFARHIGTRMYEAVD